MWELKELIERSGIKYQDGELAMLVKWYFKSKEEIGFEDFKVFANGSLQK